MGYGGVGNALTPFGLVIGPYGKREHNAADCSCGCRHFLALPEPLSLDWGVCINPRSPRSGLLTFEHQGCEFFEYDDTEVDLACCQEEVE